LSGGSGAWRIGRLGLSRWAVGCLTGAARPALPDRRCLTGAA
jgi:hypothetical protein